MIQWTPKISLIQDFFCSWNRARLCRSRNKEVTTQVLEDIKQSYHSEFHCERPFKLNKNMDLLYEFIPSVKNEM